MIRVNPKDMCAIEYRDVRLSVYLITTYFFRRNMVYTEMLYQRILHDYTEI